MGLFDDKIPILKKKRSPKNMEDGVKFWKKIDGHRIYYYENFDFMSMYRELGVRKGFSEFELGIKHSDLIRFIEIQSAQFNDANFTGAAASLDYLKMISNQFVSERITLEIGGWGILVDKENWQEPTSKDIDVKIKLLKNKEVRAFFLTNALRYLSILSVDLNISNIEASLKNPRREMVESLFLTLIQTNLFDGLWKDLMPNPYGWQGKLVGL